MQPIIDYFRIGQRVREARIAMGLTQAELAAIVDCSNNHISHIEVGQTKLPLDMLLKLSSALEKDVDYFLCDTPYVSKSHLIDTVIAEKLDKCTPQSLLMISGIIDVLIESQNLYNGEKHT